MNNISITLITPCFNEEINIQKGVLDKIGNYTRHDDRFVEVLIIDDGSDDNSKRIIKEKYLTEFPKFKLIENVHQGKAAAIITGFHLAKGSYSFFTDIDLASPIEEGEKLISEIKNGFDIVIGSRSTNREGAPLTRKMMAVGFIFIRNFIIGLKGIKDTQCGFKIFNTDIANRLVHHLKVFDKNASIQSPSVSAGFDIEMLFLAQKLGVKIKEVPVTWRHAETKRVNFFKDSVETIKDILKIKYYDISKKYDTTK